MTTILAKKTAKGTTFAWDTQTTWMGRGMLGADKVFTNGPVTFGAAGSARSSDILKFMSIPDRKSYEPGYTDEEWIVSSLVPAIIREFKSVDAVESGSFDSEGCYIISVGNELGYLSAQGSFVTDSSGVHGVGSGSPYAIGAVTAGASLKRAVEIAAQWDLYTGGEVKEITV